MFVLEKELWGLIEESVMRANKEVDVQGGRASRKGREIRLMLNLGDGVNLTDWRRAVEQDALSHVSHPMAAFQVETRRWSNTT